MNIWLIKTGEPLPCDPENPRLFRTGLLANTLVERGHSVVWWSATFNHALKKHRFRESVSLQLQERLRLVLVHSPGYTKNVSLARIADHRAAASEFSRLVGKEENTPDLIVCAYPTADLCEAALSYARPRNVPVVIDIRDLWPDTYSGILPPGLRWAGQMVLTPARRRLRRILSQATALTAITPEILEWGLSRAGRQKSPRDNAFALAYPASDVPPDRSTWIERGVPAGATIACFMGAFGRQVEIRTLVKAARQLAERRANVHLVLCGSGDRHSRLARKMTGLSNVTVTGWVNASQIRGLMEIAAIGLVPYRTTPDFARSIPNKVIEYCSGSLAIVSTLQGKAAQIIAENQCGVTVRNGAPDELADALEALAADPKRLAGMRRRAFDLFQREFKASVVYNRMAEHCEWIARNFRVTEAIEAT